MSEKLKGAGAKGTAGYWGYSTDDGSNGRSEDRYEENYKMLIPRNTYNTITHDIISCKTCLQSPRNTIEYCEKFGLSFEPLPRETVVVGNRRITRCVYCEKSFRNDPIRKKHHKANKTDSKR